jgi:hypothetical protein
MDTVTVIIMMAISGIYPSKDSTGIFRQKYLARDLTNTYKLVIEESDSAGVKSYYTYIREHHGDTVRIPYDDYYNFYDVDMDNLLKSLQTNSPNLCDSLQSMLLHNPVNIPCRYWDADDDDGDDYLDIGMAMYSKNNSV